MVQTNEPGYIIITNGSYKSKYWWTVLAQLLDENDEVHWSLDGWNQTTNEQYRVNSDWKSIIEGIEAFFENNDTTFRVWDAIAFRFNELHLNLMIDDARDLGFDLFKLTKSSKFGSISGTYPENDPLEPLNKELVPKDLRYKREEVELSDKVRPGADMLKLYRMRRESLKLGGQSAVCMIGNKGVFLNSRGEFYPCCWVANRYHHNQDWLDRGTDMLNLKIHTLEEILKNPFWETEFLKFDSFECKNRCTPDKLNDRSHTEEW